MLSPPEVESTEWQAPLGFKKAVKEALVSTPMPRLSRLGNSSSSSDLALREEPRRAPSNPLSCANHWANWDAKASDRELQIQREELAAMRANHGSESSIVRTDIHRPVNITDAGRSAPGQAIRVEYIHRSSPVVAVATSALNPVLTSYHQESRIISGGSSDYTRADTPQTGSTDSLEALVAPIQKITMKDDDEIDLIIFD